MSSKHKKGSKTSVKASTDLSRISEMTAKEKLSLLKPLSPDDPIFKRGWVIGGVASRRSLPITKAKK
jgi:hypothetical protein